MVQYPSMVSEPQVHDQINQNESSCSESRQWLFIVVIIYYLYLMGPMHDAYSDIDVDDMYYKAYQTPQYSSISINFINNYYYHPGTTLEQEDTFFKAPNGRLKVSNNQSMSH